MIPVIQGVAKIGIEGVDIIEAGKVRQNFGQPFRNSLLGELDLSHAIVVSENHRKLGIE